jgi:dihydropteroate synthase
MARALDVPVLVGASRKSFLAVVDADAAPRERLGASIAAALFAAHAGAAMLRVHDVRATRQALDVERLVGRREA